MQWKAVMALEQPEVAGLKSMKVGKAVQGIMVMVRRVDHGAQGLVQGEGRRVRVGWWPWATRLEW